MRVAKQHQVVTVRHEWRLGTPIEAKDFEFLMHEVRKEVQGEHGRTTDDRYSVTVGDDEVIVYFDVTGHSVEGAGSQVLVVSSEFRRAVDLLQEAMAPLPGDPLGRKDISRMEACSMAVLQHLRQAGLAGLP